MDWSYEKFPGLCIPLILLLLRMSTGAVAELSTSILPSPVLELRQATSTTSGQATPTTGDDSLPSSTDASTTSSASATSTGSVDHGSGSSDDDTDDGSPSHVFNFYFLLIAIFIAILLLGFVFAGRRRKKRALLIMQGRHQALRRDVEGWPGRQHNNSRNPTGGQRGGASRWNWRNRNEPAVVRHDEGLDELGEAPPPYDPNDKPPSISVTRRDSHGSERDPTDDSGVTVPLRTLSRTGTTLNPSENPPGYRQAPSHDTSEDSAEITRPEAVATTTPATPGQAERWSSSDRRLLGETDSSHE